MNLPAISRRAFLRGRVTGHSPGLSSSRPQAEAAADQPPFNRSLAGAVVGRVFAVNPISCLGQASQVCTVCKEHCPVPGAITFSGLLPVIRDDLCIGCAECADACPAPVRAIRLVQ